MAADVFALRLGCSVCSAEKGQFASFSCAVSACRIGGKYVEVGVLDCKEKSFFF